MKKLITFFQQLFCKHHYRYTEINHDGKNTVECKYCGKRKSVILFLALALVMCGCTYKTVKGTKVFNNDYIETVLFVDDENDTCEYLYYNRDEFYHKGNCKFCAERRKKEQEELIRKIKEQ